ncbi:tripartite tricarboxylate transporter substrate binding protein [Variovorax gossypii]|jgi:tripartite-type tricarboxylate transporter receptor subunit TctC|uniref:Tripartite tricarboxylate transporter substrate binding protein n=1 Tax=Variovorax gossypii TaxID=1679495 RepID=A0A3S0GVQ1_9BURK|nr:tripartite tricarboxylate transporter substrate-binding protein [Variovorax gossypii]RTQ32980.1 tripartite tricarboxylate transporter substrate binding protein [Variovorax gossypii]
MKNLPSPFRWLSLIAMLWAMPHLAIAQNWPTKPVRLVASFPPGTPGDVIARLIQPALQTVWSQPVIVENKPGAGGNLAAGEVAQSKDEHTLLVGPDTVLTINPHLYKRLGFDLRTSLKPVTYFASFNQVLVCNPATEIVSLQKFSQLPASRTYASGGAGTPSHMTMEMLQSTLGTKLTHVPYRGPGPAALDIMGGNVDCGFIVASVVLPHIQSGRLRAIAVSGKERSALLPAVPTVAESGHPGFDATFFETLMAPAGLPAPVVERIQRDVRTALQTTAIRSRLAEMDLRVEANSSQDALSRSREDFAKWGTIAQKTKLQLD